MGFENAPRYEPPEATERHDANEAPQEETSFAGGAGETTIVATGASAVDAQPDMQITKIGPDLTYEALKPVHDFLRDNPDHPASRAFIEAGERLEQPDA